MTFLCTPAIKVLKYNLKEPFYHQNSTTQKLQAAKSLVLVRNNELVSRIEYISKYISLNV